MCAADAVQHGGWSFGRGGVFWGKRRHHQRGKNKTVNIFECVVAIGAASDGLMWAGKGGKRWVGVGVSGCRKAEMWAGLLDSCRVCFEALLCSLPAALKYFAYA